MAGDQNVIGVFDSGGNDLFPDAQAMRVQVIPRAKVPKHPLETGATVEDHIIFEPVEIQLSVILKPETVQDTYQQIITLFRNPQLVTIVTKVDSYPNMILEAPPHDETGEMADTIAMGLKFSEFTQVSPQTGALPASMVKTKSNASTTKTGQKNPGTPTKQQQSALFSLLHGSGPQ